MSNQSTVEATRDILNRIEADPFGVPYRFELELRGEVLLMSAVYEEKDIFTGKVEPQRTRKWFISQYATESEIVQTALKCILTSAEHNTREHFRYGGTAVFGPHINIGKLQQIAKEEDSLDHRI